MIPTLRVLIHMGSLQRLLPFWIGGLVTLILGFSPLLLLAVAYGVLMQFFVEYAMHRFLLHRAPPTEQGLSLAIHTVILWPALGLGGALVFGVVAIFFGSVSAFAFYEYCHTLAHLNVPKGWFGTRVTQSHLAHHFQDHDATYHVSIGMGWIDRLFGTAHDRDTAKARYDRKTILSMGMDPEDLRLVTARKAYGLPKMPGNRRGPPTETGA